MRRCADCSTLRYVPNAMSPAVLITVDHEDRLLLVHQTYGPYQHEWDLAAGFVEAGETLERAVIREMWEKTAWAAAQLTYVGSHPWSFSGPAALLAGVTATVTDPTLRLGPGETAQARWLSRAELREPPPAQLPTFPYTISLIHRFLDA